MDPLTDYSSFSLEAIQKSLRDLVADVKQKTGASDEEINAALAISAEKIMKINFLLLPGGKPE